MTDPAANEAIVQLARDEFGGVDVIFLNAGIMPTAPHSALKTDEWHQTVDVNIKGVLNGVAATNLVEGAVVDGIGNALYGALTFRDGVPEQSNFDTYRMIRHSERPKAIDVHFVESDIDPTGLGEPAFPPIFGALANAIYSTTGKRVYEQPFAPQLEAFAREATG